MEAKIFNYPKEIFNEGEVLTVYKEKFPEIVAEYEKIVKGTYLKPAKYKEIVLKKSEEFDKGFSKMFIKYRYIKKDLESLIEFDIEMHRNYAFNFWLISYAIGDGHLAIHYVQEIENLLKKIYKEKEQFQKIRDIFIRTDYEIFYHKIIRTSVEICNFLNQFPKTKRLLQTAKNKKKRKNAWDIAFNFLKKQVGSKKWQWVLNLKDKTMFYMIMNETVDNYEANEKKAPELKEIKSIVQKTIKLAREKIGAKEAKKLENLYLLIKYMLWAKDSVFGKKDLKLLPFWQKLTNGIIRKWEEKYKVKISSGDSSFLSIPWFLNKK